MARSPIAVASLVAASLCPLLTAANESPDTYVWKSHTSATPVDPGFGRSITAGDINYDGFPDTIVGSWPDGAVYIYNGLSNALMYQITGSAAEQFGWSVSSGFDVDGDGRHDILVGAPAALGNGGRFYLYSGLAVSGGMGPMILKTGAGPEPASRFGHAVALIGDSDGDGFSEYGITSPYDDSSGLVDNGAVFTYRGRDHSPWQYKFGTATGQRMGMQIAAIGDFNGNGNRDFAVGSQYASFNGPESGAVWIYDGNHATLATFTGSAAFDWYGYDIDGADDINLDGRTEVIIGAPRAQSNRGRVEVRGITGGPLFQQLGQIAGQMVGSAVAGVGDVTGDGIADFAFRTGCPLEGYGAQCQGGPSQKTEVYRGSKTNAFAPNSVLVYPQGFGVMLARGGDQNGDGIGEILMSTSRATETAGQFTHTGFVCEWSTNGPFGLDYTLPTTPAQFTASAAACANIRLSWIRFADCLGYRIYRDGNLIADVDADTGDYIDVPPPNTHTYSLAAYNGAPWFSTDQGPAATAQATLVAGNCVTTTLVAEAVDSIFLAGSVVEGPGPGLGQHPAGWRVPVPANAVVSCVTQSGSVLPTPFDGWAWSGGDGQFQPPLATNIPGKNGLSGITHFQRYLFLAGVFLDDSVPTGPAPPALNFSINALGISFTDLSPQLRQVFFIGDGYTGTGSGSVQRFHAPAGATRLHIGFADASPNPAAPGWYADSHGSLTVKVSIAAHSTSYGTGLAGTNGIPGLTASASPAIGTSLDLVLGNSRGAATNALLLVGTHPVDQAGFGGSVLVGAPATLFLSLPSAASIKIPAAIPNDVSLMTQSIVLQSLVADPGAPQGVAMSQGLKLYIGQ